MLRQHMIPLLFCALSALSAHSFAAPRDSVTQRSHLVSVKSNPTSAVTFGKLTAVTIDICALKQGLNLSTPLLVALTSHLSDVEDGYNILRIGGSDGNKFDFSPTNTPMAPCRCGKSCTMTGQYWNHVLDFLRDTNMKLVFGVEPDVATAIALINYTALKTVNGSSLIHAWAFGNELSGNAEYAEFYRKSLSAVRSVLGNPGDGVPFLIAPDAIGQRGHGIAIEAEQDPPLQQNYDWIKLFASTSGHLVDAVSWHTYDFHSDEIGTSDHHPLNPFDSNVSRLFDQRYLDYVGSVHQNITSIVADAMRGVTPPPVWLTETNSICHQGVYNFTNAFGNSLWLVNRLGVLASQGLPLMARQSLIGYNYSLLGNFPSDPIYPAPDYFTTVLFNRLVGALYLPTFSASAHPTASIHAYCARGTQAGIVVVVANFDATHAVTFHVNITANTPDRATITRNDYVLAPRMEPPHLDNTNDGNTAHARKVESGVLGRTASPAYPAYTSRVIALNGAVLRVSRQGSLPVLAPKVTTGSTVTVPPQNILFSVFPDVHVDVCA
eukprot:m.856721 g.856721  ORF g.856721 m.856721 type:complete len:551 (-) comp23516_c0_seq1:2439-4091(-)